jgi:hypothetical protein
MLAQHSLCASGYCFETVTAGIFQCSGAIVSQATPPIRCLSMMSTCTFHKDKISGLTMTQQCECGYDGYPYCPLFPGDDAYMEYTNDLQNYLGSLNLTHCNTERHGPTGFSFQIGNFFWCAQNLTRIETYHYLRSLIYTSCNRRQSLI